MRENTAFNKLLGFLISIVTGSHALLLPRRGSRGEAAKGVADGQSTWVPRYRCEDIFCFDLQCNGLP